MKFLSFRSAFRHLLLTVILASTLALPPADGEKIYIDIGSPGKRQFPIALPLPRTDHNPDAWLIQKMNDVLAFDLQLSGLFRILPRESYLEPKDKPAREDFLSWVMIGAEGLVRTETENVNNRIRKYYSLTPKGKKESESRMSDFREYIDLMKNLFY